MFNVTSILPGKEHNELKTISDKLHVWDESSQIWREVLTCVECHRSQGTAGISGWFMCKDCSEGTSPFKSRALP